MENSQKGFIVPVVIAVIALLSVGGGAYLYINKKSIKFPSLNILNVAPSNNEDSSATFSKKPIITAIEMNRPYSINGVGNLWVHGENLFVANSQSSSREMLEEPKIYVGGKLAELGKPSHLWWNGTRVDVIIGEKGNHYPPGNYPIYIVNRYGKSNTVNLKLGKICDEDKYTCPGTKLTIPRTGPNCQFECPIPITNPNYRGLPAGE